MNVLGWIVVYLVFACILAVFVGKTIKRSNPCMHEWSERSHPEFGLMLKSCALCGRTEIDS